MIKVPCRGCSDRSLEPINCHTICEKYLEYRSKLDKKKHDKRIRSQIDSIMYQKKPKLGKGE